MIVRCQFKKMIPISDLKRNPRNRNRHPEDQIKRLASILKYQGWRYPVKVSNRSGYITSGHGRLEAAILNGWKEVPCDFQDYETDEMEYEDLIADNAVALFAEIDLSGVNADLADLGPELDIEMLGIKNFSIDPIHFEPGTEDEQGKLDEKKPVQCPNCGEQFVPKG